MFLNENSLIMLYLYLEVLLYFLENFYGLFSIMSSNITKESIFLKLEHLFLIVKTLELSKPKV